MVILLIIWTIVCIWLISKYGFKKVWGCTAMVLLSVALLACLKSCAG